MNENNSTQAYKILFNNMPSIGFLSRKKRVLAYIKITAQTQEMIDAEEISEEEALFVLSLLMRKCKNFQKAGMMAALSLDNIGKGVLQPIGLRYANEMRANMKLMPIGDGTTIEP